MYVGSLNPAVYSHLWCYSVQGCGSGVWSW